MEMLNVKMRLDALEADMAKLMKRPAPEPSVKVGVPVPPAPPVELPKSE